MAARGEGRLESLMRGTGALQEGHFRLSSGRHAGAYVQCARLLELPERALWAGRELASSLAQHQPDSVLSPALGGMIIGFAVAQSLGLPFRFVERRQGALALRRGFELQQGERVVVVEDVVTTGGSARETLELAEKAGAMVPAVGAVVDRSGPGNPFARPFEALLRLQLESFEAAACPLCAAGLPLEQPGSRAGV